MVRFSERQHLPEPVLGRLMAVVLRQLPKARAEMEREAMRSHA